MMAGYRLQQYSMVKLAIHATVQQFSMESKFHAITKLLQIQNLHIPLVQKKHACTSVRQ